MKKKKLKVLLVDDEKEFVESLSERLELRNLESDVAYDGEQALQALKEGEPDVMVLDLRMPGIDGIEDQPRCPGCYPYRPWNGQRGGGGQETGGVCIPEKASGY